MTTLNKLMNLLATLTPSQRLRLFKYFNQISGPVTIPETPEIYSLAEYIRVQAGGTKTMVAFAKKVFYGYEQAVVRIHYRTGNTLLDDILSGKRIYLRSY